MREKPWFDVLLAARRIAHRKETLTSGELALEASIETRIASAWLSKFARWGYVKKKEKIATGNRWSWSWVVTRWGIRAKIEGYKAKKTTLRIAANPEENKE